MISDPKIGESKKMKRSSCLVESLNTSQTATSSVFRFCNLAPDTFELHNYY